MSSSRIVALKEGFQRFLRPLISILKIHLSWIHVENFIRSLRCLYKVFFQSIRHHLHWLTHLHCLHPDCKQQRTLIRKFPLQLLFFPQHNIHQPSQQQKIASLKVLWWQSKQVKCRKSVMDCIGQQEENIIWIKCSLGGSQRRDVLRLFANTEMWVLRLEFIGIRRNSPGVTAFLWQMPFTASLGKGKAARNVEVSQNRQPSPSLYSQSVFSHHPRVSLLITKENWGSHVALLGCWAFPSFGMIP